MDRRRWNATIWFFGTRPRYLRQNRAEKDARSPTNCAKNCLRAHGESGAIPVCNSTPQIPKWHTCKRQPPQNLPTHAASTFLDNQNRLGIALRLTELWIKFKTRGRSRATFRRRAISKAGCAYFITGARKRSSSYHAELTPSPENRGERHTCPANL